MKKSNNNSRFLKLVFFIVISIICIIFFISKRLHIIEGSNSVIPQLDSMKAIEYDSSLINGKFSSKTRDSYFDVQNKFGLKLLNSKLSDNNPYMISKVETDGIDNIKISCLNYIIGDTSDYKYNEKEVKYTYSHGKEYYSPISLDVDIILSKSQEDKGLNTEYLGEYNLIDDYTSSKGYRVNIIESNTNNTEDTSEKIAIFVADGVRYTLKGRTSIQNIKNIVDTME